MSFSVTINDFSPAPEKRVAETTVIAEALANVVQKLRAPGGVVTSGNIQIAGANGPITVGTWTFAPQASS